MINRKFSILAILLAASLPALATGAGQNGTGNGGGGGGGGGGGAGIGVGVGISAAQSQARASNRSEIGIATNVGLSNTIGSSAQGGSIGAGAVQVTAAGDTYKAASAPAFAPGASGPVSSCRLFIGLGATNTSGSGSAGIPIGNDQACVVENAHRLMNRMNAMKANAFTYDDYLRPVCKFEGMADTAECKALTQQETPRAQSVGMGYVAN